MNPVVVFSLIFALDDTLIVHHRHNKYVTSTKLVCVYVNDYDCILLGMWWNNKLLCGAGRCKSWTLDSGLDCGMKSGLEYGLYRD